MDISVQIKDMEAFYFGQMKSLPAMLSCIYSTEKTQMALCATLL